jgi:hypothetical protein
VANPRAVEPPSFMSLEKKMRLWSLHPKYLDSKGLVALWREGLLAQNVLAGKTKGYKNHPQLDRFKNTINPLGAIANYLRIVVYEAESREYSFDKSKIDNRRLHGKINVTSGQLEYEFGHLLNKLKHRDPKRFSLFQGINEIDVHPLFLVIPGNIEAWEVT